jgi:chemotaxis signal transduction protein
MIDMPATDDQEPLIRPDLKRLIEHIPAALNCRLELHALAQQWDLLAILGEMSGQDMDMSSTREGFRRLTTQLLNHLSEEILNNVLHRVAAKAQVTVDILIRNLFERTADIGFLATDGDVRLFLNGQLDAASLTLRFQEYVDKYSVYDNIMLLDPAGRVLVQLDAQNPVEQSHDPLIVDALNTSQPFVESYRYSDLCASKPKSLIYSFRVTENDRPNSRALGVLCLCFRFENEMQGIFEKLSDGASHEVLLLLDKDGYVLSSSDPFHIPVGACVQTAFDGAPCMTWFAGRPYLAHTSHTRGYQGYFGQGWLGHVVVPLQQAFLDEASSSSVLDRDVHHAVMHNPRLFSESLRKIPQQAESIQKALDCTVWNGNAKNECADASGVSARVLLREIGNTGRRTQAIFESEIARLHSTIVSTALNDASFVAALAIDIMDRNLYERANDCRWWALTRRFRETMSDGTPLPTAVQLELSDILRYINNLYTVYSTLVLFDKRGTVLSVSSPESREWVGQTLSDAWVADILALRHSRQYAVSAFEPCGLYGNRPTFVYGAVVRNMDDAVTGGIAIVFDSAPQFKSMLEDAMPRDADGHILEGAIGLFVDAAGLVIAACGGCFQPGDTVSLPCSLLHPGKGESVACVHEYGGVYYAAGARLSQGYREFKSDADDYAYEVTAIVMIPLGAVALQAKMGVQRFDMQAGRGNVQKRGLRVNESQYATFYAAGYWLAIPSEAVQEAIMVETITHLPGFAGGLGGAVIHKGASLPIIELDRGTAEHRRGGAAKLVVIASGQEITSIGILADQLGPIIGGGENYQALGQLGELGCANFTKGVLKTGTESGDPMAVVIDPQALLQVAGGPDFEQQWKLQIEKLE